MIRRSLLAFILSATPALAQTGTAEAGGYIDYLFDNTFPPAGENLYDHLLQARLNTKWYPLESLSGVLEIRTRLFYGTLVRETPGFADQLKHNAGLGNLGVTLWNRGEGVGYAEIDRCFLNWNPEHLQVTLGRQRVAWGTNLVWNPVDLFNPLSILDFDYIERPAADAARVQYYTGEVSKIEVALKPGSNETSRIVAAQWTTNSWNYDFHLLAGVRGDSWCAGGAWAGDISGGGFRGELLASEIPAELRTDASTMFSGAISGDYTFPTSLYVHAEILYNSQGVRNNAASARPRALALGLLSPARWSLYEELSYDISPLLRGSIFFIHNPDDLSLVAVPSLTWSVVTNLDATLLVMSFHGAGGTEYGKLGTALFARCKWSF